MRSNVYTFLRDSEQTCTFSINVLHPELTAGGVPQGEAARKKVAYTLLTFGRRAYCVPSTMHDGPALV